METYSKNLFEAVSEFKAANPTGTVRVRITSSELEVTIAAEGGFTFEYSTPAVSADEAAKLAADAVWLVTGKQRPKKTAPADPKPDKAAASTEVVEPSEAVRSDSLQSEEPKRRRRPAAAAISPDAVLSVEQVLAIGSAPEKKTRKKAIPQTENVNLPGQESLLDLVGDGEFVTSMGNGAFAFPDEAGINTESAAVEATTEVIPASETTVAETVVPEITVPVTDEERLEAALNTSIPNRVGNPRFYGRTLGELFELEGADAAMKDLYWFAFQYRGSNVAFKNAAAVVYTAAKEMAAKSAAATTA